MSEQPDILHTIRILRDRIGPTPRAVWVVDMGRAAAEFRRAYRERGFFMEHPGSAAGELLIGPLPVCEWCNQPAPPTAEYERNLRLGRWFVRWPGVWLELNGGQHQRFAVTTLDEVQRMAVALLRDCQSPMRENQP